MQRPLTVLATLAIFASAACQNNVPGTINVTASDKGFEPRSVKLKKGAPATLIFTRTTDETCATEVVFPELKVKKDLPKGQAVSITIPTEKEQTLNFQCGMGMYKSSVVISSN